MDTPTTNLNNTPVAEEEIWQKWVEINTLAQSLWFTDVDQALLHSMKAVGMLREHGMEKWLPGGLRLLGQSLRNCGRFSESIEVLNDALDKIYANGMEEHRWHMLVLFSLAESYAGIGNFDKSLEYIHQALQVAALIGHENGILQCHQMLASLYSERCEFHVALHHALRAVEVANRLENTAIHPDTPGLVFLAQLVLSRIYIELEDFESGLMIAQELAEQARASSNLQYLVKALIHAQVAADRSGDLETAIAFSREALSAAVQFGDPNLVNHIRLSKVDMAARLGDVATAARYLQDLGSPNSDSFRSMVGYYHLVNANVMRQEGRLNEAYSTLQQALCLAEITESPRKLYDAHYLASEVQRARGQFESALDHFKLAAEALAGMSRQRQGALTSLQDRLNESEREALTMRAQLLETRLERQRAELTSTAMSLARQSELLGRFRNDLRTIVRDATDPIQGMKAIREKLKELPCEAIDWTKFEAEFQQTYPEFRSKLLERYRDLTPMELKIASLLKLKLQTPDIAKLTCLSERSIEWHRLKLRKKLGLEKGQEIFDALADI